jgi:Sensors of blue-light using FAD
MQTIRLIYTSAARPDLSYADVTDCLRTAVEHNAEAGISGLLCYGDGQFLQVLEGEPAAVNSLYNRIVRDPRHFRCELLRYEDVDARQFADWSMKLVGFEGAERRDALLRLGSERFEPSRLSAEQALAFLSELAERERRLAA